MNIDMSTLEATDIYKLMTSNIIPRPIAWILTENEGVVNIAPFSYFAPLSSNPPCVVVSIGHKLNGDAKDTLVNIRQTKKATICMVNEANMEKMHLSSKALNLNQSEANEFDINLIKKFDSFPPVCEGVTTAFFCDFNQEITIEGSPTIPLVLEIKHTFIDEKSDTTPICRIGRGYAKIGESLITPTIP